MSNNSMTLKNVEVSFSTMLNSPEKAQYGRNFKIMVPVDSPELEKIKNAYKALNEQAKIAYGEKLGKKLKNADMQIFEESVYKEGFVELKFNVFFMKQEEVEDENGKKTKVNKEVLNPIYKDKPMVCYLLDDNGNRVPEGSKKFYPASQNIVDITFSLVAKYDSKNNRPSIMFKAEEVIITKSQLKRHKEGGNGLGFISLGDEDDTVEEQHEKAEVVSENEMFTEADISNLDV